jgi:peptidoglycan/LPS O-acetylase OafA/YrhL
VVNNAQSENQAFLNGIRGAAALYVLVAHCTIWGGGITLPNPKIAVDVFMVLSGYLMMYLANMRAEIDPPGTLTYAVRFWIRRFFRIAPVYYIILAAAFLLLNQIKSGYEIFQSQAPERWLNTLYDLNGPSGQKLQLTLANVVSHVSFAFGLLPKYCNSVPLPDWSIGLEMQFYAAFPFILILGRRFGLFKTMVGLFIGAVGAKCLIYFCFGHLSTLYPEPSFLLIKIKYFFIGMLIANAVFHIRERPILAGSYLVFGLALAATASLPITLVAALIFILAVGNDQHARLLSMPHAALSRLLGNSLTKFMADVSYGVYLVHGFFISILGGWLYSQPFTAAWSPLHRLAWLLLGTVIGAYAVAFLLHISVERPGINLGRKILSRLRANRSNAVNLIAS